MRDRAVFIGVACAVLVIVLIVLAVSLLPGSAPETAQVLLPEDTSPPVSENAGEAEKDKVLSVTPETVQSALSTLSRVQEYTRTVTAETFWPGGESTRSIDVAVSGGSTALTVTEGGKVKHILLSGEEMYIWYDASSGVYSGPAAEKDADEYQGILTYEDILTLDTGNILDAGYEEYKGEECLFAEYTDGVFGYVSRVWVSMESGLLMGSETYDGEELIFRVSSTVPVLAAPEESVFALPGAT